MSGFSEMVRRPEKTSFSMACNLLSQYIKEKGCKADLGFEMLSLGLDPAARAKPETYRPPTTMSLLPGVNVVGEKYSTVMDDDLGSTGSMEMLPSLSVSIPTSKQPEKAQLTMFYGGKVLVFDNFPAQKAGDLMKLASQGSTTDASGEQNFIGPLTAVADHPINPSPVNPPPASFPPRPQPKSSDLPIARKASLHRFLEKRRDRINARAPYQLSSGEAATDAASLKLEEINRPWLGLGPQTLNSRR